MQSSSERLAAARKIMNRAREIVRAIDGQVLTLTGVDPYAMQMYTRVLSALEGVCLLVARDLRMS